MPSLVIFYSCFSLIKVTVIIIEWSTEKITTRADPEEGRRSEKRPELATSRPLISSH